MSALGQKRTCAVQTEMSALPPKATSNATYGDVRFGPKADIGARQWPDRGTRPFTAFANDS